jgi:4'-phosphopantetheinyl transferase
MVQDVRVRNDNTNALHLWCAFPDDLLDPAAAQACEGLLSEPERERWQRFRPERRRREYLATHALARVALSHCHSSAPQDWRFTTNDYGKPSPAPDCGLRFNLSNSLGLAACVVADAPVEVGVDVEAHTRAREIAKLTRRVFSAAERAQLDALAETERPDRYLMLWTLKEAYIKARGMGMALPLGEISFLFDGAGNARLEVSAGVDDDPARWRFRWLDYAGHRIAMVAEGAAGRVLEMWEVRPVMSPPKRIRIEHDWL